MLGRQKPSESLIYCDKNYKFAVAVGTNGVVSSRHRAF